MKSDANISLFVHTPAGEIAKLKDININTKIHDLKPRIELEVGILAELQIIFCSNKKLDDVKSVCEEKLKRGSVIRVTIKEESLQQIFIHAVNNDITQLFKTGIQFINIEPEDKTSDHMETWNKFVPLRAFQALFSASLKGHLAMISELLERSAVSIKMLSKYDRNVLHIAAYHGDIKSVRLLLSRGADYRLSDYNGLTPMALAAAKGHLKCEKRIWLFEWNMEVINIGDNKDTYENDGDGNLNEKANEYYEKYNRAVHDEISFPFINIKEKASTAPAAKSKQTSVTTFPKISSSPFKVHLSKLPLTEDDSNIPYIFLQNGVEMKSERVKHTKSSFMSSTASYSNKRKLDEKDQSKSNHASDAIADRSNERSIKIDRAVKHETVSKCNNEIETQNTQVLRSDYPEQFNNDNHYERLKDIEHSRNTKNQNESQVDHKKLPNEYVVITNNINQLKSTAADTNKAFIEDTSGSDNGCVGDAGSILSENQYSSDSASHDRVVHKTRYDKPVTNSKDHVGQITIQVEDSEIPGLNFQSSEQKYLNNAENCWRPNSSLSTFTTKTPSSPGSNSLSLGRKVLTYEDWLLVKKQKKKTDIPIKRPDSCISSETENTNSKNKKTYEDWLQNKKKTKPVTENRHLKKKKTLSENACTFERWLQMKNARHTSNQHEHNKNAYSNQRSKIKIGMTFEEWKKWKKDQGRRAKIELEAANETKDNITTRSDITFEKWLNKKDELRKIELERKTSQKQKEELKKEWETQSRLNNPRQRTFEEWYLEKKYNTKLEKRYLKYKQEDMMKKHVRRKTYPSDVTLIYDMWLNEKMKKEILHEKKLLRKLHRNVGYDSDSSLLTLD